jgi:hypothetical protein
MVMSLQKRTADFSCHPFNGWETPTAHNATPCEVYANIHRSITDIMGRFIRLLNAFKLAVQ